MYPSNPKDNLGNESCLVIPDWSDSEIEDRYKDYTASCQGGEWGSLYNAISSYQSRFKSFMESVDTIFGEINTDFESFSTSLSSTGDKTYKLYENTLYYVGVELNPVIYTISDPDDGIIYNLNCIFIREVYDEIELSVCDNFLPNLFLLFICLLAMSTLSLVLMFISMSLNSKLRSAPSPS